jgi:hypothetical protein
MVRATHHIDRCHLRGEELRSKSRLPGRSLLPSSTLKCVAALRSSRTFDRSAHQNFRTDSRDPPDLGANYPDAFRSLRPGRKAGFPLVGLSKDRPSIVSITESDSRKRSSSASPRARLASLRAASFGMRTPILILRAVFVVSHHLDGLLLRDLAALLHAASDPGVHRVSSCRETGFPAVRLLPFEAFPPPTATEAGTSPCLRGPASPLRPFPTVTFTANLAFSPFLSHRSSDTVARAFVPMRAGASRPCSIVGSVARSNVSARSRPVLPWAWPARPAAFTSGALPANGSSGPEDRAYELPTSRQRPFRRMTPSV